MNRKSRNVKFEGMHPAMWPMTWRLDDAWKRWLGFEVTVTASNDGKHLPTSDHNWGGAIDVRTWTTPTSGIQIQGQKRKDLFNKTKRLLGKDWYVHWHETHFHISYRPTETIA